MAISVENGPILYHTRLGAAFKTEDVLNFLKELRTMAGAEKQIAIFADGASIHKACVKPARDRADIDMEILINLPYRPDLNGIEYSWKRAKHHYRKFV